MNDSPQEKKAWRRDTFLLGVILVGLIFFSLVGYGLKNQNAQSQKTSDFTACISHWATQVTNRTDTLAGFNGARLGKLDRIIRDVYLDLTKRVPLGRATLRQERRTFTRDLHAYVRVSNLSNEAIRTHPPPPAPAVQC
jgi:hypothetical protein